MVLLRTKTGFLKIVIMTVPGLICIGIVFMIIGCSLIHKSDGGEFSPDLDDCVVNHMLENRPDILEYFGAQGMDTSRSNWENIVIEWSKVDPEGFEDARQRGLNECIVGLPPCNPPSPYYPSSMAIAECIKLYTEQLAGNKNECWSDYVKNCKNWDIPSGFMPCMTGVSTIWYIAGVKEMDRESSTLYDEPWSWHWHKNGYPSSYPGNAWVNCEHFYSYIETYYPDLLVDKDIPYHGIGSREGFWLWDNYYEVDFEQLTETDPEQIRINIVEGNLNVGDIIQYFGDYCLEGTTCSKCSHRINYAPEYVDINNAKCPECCCDNKNPCEDPGDIDKCSDCYKCYCYKHAVIVVGKKATSESLVASFGWSPSSSLVWTDIGFDFTRVRIIKLPSNPPPPLRKNYVQNPSFENPVNPNSFATEWSRKRKQTNNLWSEFEEKINFPYNYFPVLRHTIYYGNYGDRYLLLRNFIQNSKEFAVSQNIGLLNGNSYKIRFFYRNGCDSGDFDQIGYIYLKKENTPIEQADFKWDFPINTSIMQNNWTPITATTNPDVNISHTENYEIGVYLRLAMSNWCHIDDIQLYETD